MEFLHPAIWHDHDIDLPGDCTLQCGMCLWTRDGEFTNWQHPSMWHVALGWCAIELPVAAPCNVTNSYGIIKLNSPDGSTLRCGRWLWDDMPLNSPKRPPYWNSPSGFDFNQSPQSTCHSAPVREILSKSDHPRWKKQELSYRKQIARQLRTQYIEGIYSAGLIITP